MTRKRLETKNKSHKTYIPNELIRFKIVPLLRPECVIIVICT